MRRQKKFRPPKVTTVVGVGTAVTGDVMFQGGLHLEGKVKGNVAGERDSVSTLTVSEQGVIEGDVRVENLILNGTVVGDVHASGRVELAANARVTGTVYYHLLEMAMGAEVNGKLVHSADVELTPAGAPDGAEIGTVAKGPQGSQGPTGAPTLKQSPKAAGS